jgi:hypothetical protein
MQLGFPDLKQKEWLFEIVPEYVPTKIAAMLLGISENALRIKVCRGQISAEHDGRKLKFRLADLSVSLL